MIEWSIAPRDGKRSFRLLCFFFYNKIRAKKQKKNNYVETRFTVTYTVDATFTERLLLEGSFTTATTTISDSGSSSNSWRGKKVKRA